MHGFENVLGLGALNGDGGVLRRDVGDLHIKGLRLPAQMDQILVNVAGVDHQQELLFLKAVQIYVIDGIAVLIGHDGILGLVHVQGQDIAGNDVLQERDPIGAFNDQTAHVRHVEDAAGTAAVQMLGHNAGGVLNGHFPSAEVHQSGAGRHMRGIELGALQFTHVVLPPKACFDIQTSWLEMRDETEKRHKAPNEALCLRLRT